MKRLIASVSVAAITAMTAGIALAGDTTTSNAQAGSAVEREDFINKAYPEGEGSKNYAEVDPVADGNGASPVTTGAAQGGRDQSVYRDKDGNVVPEGTEGAILDTFDTTAQNNVKADSAVESEEFTNKAYPEGRGSKNYADVEPVADDNGADAPTTAEAQGGRDGAVYKDEEANTATN